MVGLFYQLHTSNLKGAIMALKVTTNNRERRYIVREDDDVAYLKAYGFTFDETEVLRAPDELRVLGYDGYYPAVVTNGGTVAIALRYFDRDGYELDGYVAGWAVWS